MACELLKMATDDNVADSIKLAAIRDALDRAGLAAKNAVEVELGPPKPFETILEGIEAGSRAEYRRSQEAPRVTEKHRCLSRYPVAEAPIDAQVLEELDGR